MEHCILLYISHVDILYLIYRYVDIRDFNLENIPARSCFSIAPSLLLSPQDSERIEGGSVSVNVVHSSWSDVISTSAVSND